MLSKSLQSDLCTQENIHRILKYTLIAAVDIGLLVINLKHVFDY